MSSLLHTISSLSTRKRDLLALLALFALTLFFFWKIAFTNLIIARGDIFNYFYPYRDYAAQALRAGHIPLWNPYLFMGVPFLANSQVGFFYPFNLAMAWLDTTRSINWTIVLHIFIAISGVYILTRSRFQFSILAACFAATSFGLGGYLGTQIEHVNQLQGLAWIGWIFWAYDLTIGDQASVHGRRRAVLALSVFVALQLLAGHTQSVFITLIGLAVYAIWPVVEMIFVRAPDTGRMLLKRLLPILLASFFAVLLSAVQLFPTLELTRLSARSGGLPTNLAVSFSLDPRLLGRALLPDYSGALPAGGEFTAFFSVAALILMMYGLTAVWNKSRANVQRPTSNLRSISVVAIIGLVLAFGGYTPIYYALLKIFPGIDLFRAPARWLVLLTFAGSIIAGAGLDSLRDRKINNRSLVLPAVLAGLLVLLTFIAGNLIPAGASGSVGLPDAASLFLWMLAFVLAILLMKYGTRVTHPEPFLSPYSFLVALSCFELFLATRALPYNSHATAPDALTDLRPATAQLLIGAQDRTPPDRFLSISNTFFDPGDTAELKSIFSDQLSKDAFNDLIVATKFKEIIAPNLPLYYRLPAADGYDGGLLPLRNYMTFQQLFVDPSLIQSDGRLREQLKSIPDVSWLDLMNIRYIITDKSGDQWYDGVMYDLQFSTPLQAGESAATSQLPALPADALGLVYSTPFSNTALAAIDLMLTDGTTQTLRLSDPCPGAKTAGGLTSCRLSWAGLRQVKSIRVTGLSGLTLQGAALIDQASGAFQSFVIAPRGEFRLAHSGDVKVYENVDVLPRAFIVNSAVTVSNDEVAIGLMNHNQVDPLHAVVFQAIDSPVQAADFPLVTLSPGQPVTKSSSHLVSYDPENIVVDVDTSQDGYLVITDAYYPGWVATVDDRAAKINRADVLFRAIKVPQGQHRVELHYDPTSFKIGSIISLGAWIALMLLFVVTRQRVIIDSH